jgi:hypothetical protein
MNAKPEVSDPSTKSILRACDEVLERSKQANELARRSSDHLNQVLTRNDLALKEIRRYLTLVLSGQPDF